ncbi:MAG: STAS domain-containing protein [Thermoplasmatota archaeon]
MDIRKVAGEGSYKWIISGEVDRGSALKLESMIVNSQIGDDDVILDVSELMEISSEGLTSLHHIHSRLRNRGGNLKLVGARGEVADGIRLLGLIDDGLIEK